MYAINATITHHTKDASGISVDVVKQIPIFYLSGHVQGIRNEDHAEEIAHEIILPIDSDYESFTVSVFAVKI